MDETQMGGISEHNPAVKGLKEAIEERQPCKLKDYLIIAGIVIVIWAISIYTIWNYKT